jgi:hypothetical protein
MRKLTIRGREYLEFSDPVVFNVVGEFKEIEPPSEEDREERLMLFRETERFCKLYFDTDLNSRRVVIQPKYDSDPDLASCMSLIQFLIRDGVVYCYATMRSELDTIHEWDEDTLRHLAEWVATRYGLKSCKITMTVNNFHRLA